MVEELEWLIMNIQQIKLRGRFIGRAELTAHLHGAKLTYRQMCRAKCFDCMGGYADGAEDCRVTSCPLYQMMPYREGHSLVPETPEIDVLGSEKAKDDQHTGPETSVGIV